MQKHFITQQFWVVSELFWFTLNKIPRVMKLYIFLLFCSIGLAQAANSYAQNATVNLKMQNQTVQTVLDEIENQSEFSFFFNTKHVDLNRKVSIDAENSDIFKVLDHIFSGTNVKYSVVDKKVILSTELVLLPSVSQNKKTVSGIVKDENGEPIIGANVIEKGTANGTVTDMDGKYTLEVSSSTVVLQLSYIGYLTKEVITTNKSNITIVLKEDTLALEEIVVIGYGTMKKRDLTGSISSVKSEDIVKMATSSPIAALQGRAAGVSISMDSGAPNAGVSVQIRGIGTFNNSSPLYVVDGFPMADIGYLNPKDIETIEILKDASACAIYGSRGANGVIVITTKKGKKGELKIGIDAYYGIEYLASKPTMLNSSQYAELSNLAYKNAGKDPLYADTSNMPYSTKWYDEVSHLGQIQNYNINMSGGSQRMQSIFSANYYKKDGIIKSMNYDRVSLNQSNKIEATNFLNIETSLSVSMTNSKSMDSNGIFLASLIAPPDIPVIDPETNYYTGITKLRLENPVGRIARNNSKYKSLYFVGNFSANLNLTKDLVFTSRFGIKIVNSNSNGFTPVYYETADNSVLMNSVSRGTTRTTDWTADNMLTYHHCFNDVHDLTTMVAISSRSYKSDSYWASKQDTPLEREEFWYFDSTTKNPMNSGSGAELTMLSYLGRVNYNLLDRYLLTASIRTDGSSRFLKENRWGYFPSGAIAWKLSEEMFFKKWEQKWFNNVKIRLGYGTIGNENISSYYPYLTPISQQQYYTLGKVPERINGAAPSAIGNREVKWETSKQMNVGVDLGLFDNRLNITADYYVRKTNDILLDQQIPYISGYGSIIRNVGGMQNKGFELTAGFKGGKGNFFYSINGNMSFVKNKVTNLGTTSALIGSCDGVFVDMATAIGQSIRTEVGMPYGQFYGYVTDGIFQNQSEVDAYKKDGHLIQPEAKPGDFRFKDLDNNGVIDENDREFIGNPIPDITYGLSFDATYKNFDLSILFQGVVGNEIYNAAKFYYMRFDGKHNVRVEYLDNYWAGENTYNTQPIPSSDLTRNNNNFRNSDYYVENGSYLRLKNIQLGYTFSPRFTEQFKPSIRVYVAAQNLFTLTQYSGFDPEVARSYSVDRGQYPQAQQYMIGVVVGF